MGYHQLELITSRAEVENARFGVEEHAHVQNEEDLGDLARHEDNWRKKRIRQRHTLDTTQEECLLQYKN